VRGVSEGGAAATAGAGARGNANGAAKEEAPREAAAGGGAAASEGSARVGVASIRESCKRKEDHHLETCGRGPRCPDTDLAPPLAE